MSNHEAKIIINSHYGNFSGGFFCIVSNARVYEPLRDSKSFVVELPQGNQMNQQ
jgi:hypothetical protein